MSSRVKKSIKNAKYSFFGQVITLIIKFIFRYYFIKILGKEYLGLNGLFTNILSVLSFAELGIGSAINYSLYKPLSSNNMSDICMLMQFYKKVYYIIGTFIIISGVIFMPFLPLLIKDMPPISNIYLIYLLFVLDSGISYFFAYKRNMIIADQKGYIEYKYRYGFESLFVILQTIFLIITHNYIIVIIIKIIVELLENILLNNKIDSIYKVDFYNPKKKLDEHFKKEIKKNTIAMVFHKIGGIIVGSTDNILISKMIGLGIVGIYSNYLMIISAVNSVYNQFFSSICSSIGNLCASENKNRQIDMFNKLEFLNFWLCSVFTACFFNLINIFIEIYAGTDYLFSISIVAVLTFNFYIEGMRKNILTFKDAKGLFWNDRYKALYQSIINLIASIILANYFGTIGIFIGTTICFLTTVVWIEPYVLFKYGFEDDYINHIKKYYYSLLKRTLLAFSICLITYKICAIINVNLYLKMFLTLLITFMVSNIILYFIYNKSDYFKYFKKIILERKLQLIDGDNDEK